MLAEPLIAGATVFVSGASATEPVGSEVAAAGVCSAFVPVTRTVTALPASAGRTR